MSKRKDGVVKIPQVERVDTMGTNVYSSKDNESLHKSLNGEFILYQILLQRLLDENEELPIEAKEGLLKYFKPSNPIDENVMKEFDREYREEKAIHWYTRETCVYRMLNKALRTQNIDDVTAFGQFVRDLHKQLKQQYKTFAKEQKASIVTVYRGQFISKDELNRIKTTIGEIISMNSFLSTSTNREKAIEFATSRPPPNDELTSILLQILVNVKSPSRPLADIKMFSAFAEEEEILFMFGCVFRLDDVSFDQQNKLWTAKLTLCGENDEDMNKFTATLTGELNGKSRSISLGKFLVQMQKYEDAQLHYEQIIEKKSINDQIELADCYLGLGRVNSIKGDINSAITNIQKALEYLSLNCPTNDHPLISECFNDLAENYAKEKKYTEAFQFYEKALTTANNIPSVTFSGLSKVQFEMTNYNLSLEYLEKVLASQPATAYSLKANTYIQLGKVYGVMNEKDKASQMFDKAIECQLKILSPTHPDLSYTYNALGLMYSDMNEEQKAFEYIEKAHQLQLGSLPSNHSDFGETYKIFGDLYAKKEDYDQALIYYHKSLENRLKSLLWTHPLVAATNLIIGHTHWKRKVYDEASIYFHKVLDSELERKQTGDTSLSDVYKNLADLYSEKGDIDLTVTFYLQYLENELERKLFEDFSLASTYKLIAQIYYKQRRLNESLLYNNRLLDCHLRKKPIDKDQIEQQYQVIGKIYLKKRKFDETLLFYSKIQNNSSEKKKRQNSFEDIENIHFEKRHLDLASDYFEKYLQEQLAKKFENDEFIGDVNRILANIYFEKKQFDRSLESFRELLKIKLKSKSITDSSLAEIYKAIGNISFQTNQLDEALIYFNRLLDCQLEKKKNRDDSAIHDSYRFIGQIYLSKHQFNQTDIYFNQFIQSQFTQNIFTNKKFKNSSLEFEERHLNEGLKYFQQLLNKQFNQFFSVDDLNIILANMFLEKRDINQTLYFLQRLLNNQLTRKSEGDVLSANTIAIIGNVYAIAGSLGEALQNYQQSLTIYQIITPTNIHLIKQLKHRIRQVLLPNT